MLLLGQQILFEDDYLLVVDKPAGLMVEPDRNGHPNLLNYVKNHLRNKLNSSDELYAQHLHRLDRPVSGVLLFTKRREILRNLSEQFAQRTVIKKYIAITTSTSMLKKEGQLTHWHRKEKKKAVLYTEPIEHSELAQLSYRIEEINQEELCWHIELQTGKYHQIRVQLSSVGCPILGDAVYGSDRIFKQDSIALHASSLQFHHPITNEVLVISSKNPF
jgi:RluA family pseudouridine synthase